ncbi:MAG: SUMF1/EgtB/PvdO family nonheme iron enzyme [Prevotellaceae bacterium]|jgi:formylglycine-generating enzyme required for sulfatase activity|nr:SUMF1/EgtB/PvdO family nonheme iron enzyme [Prevotellaceae bacterium]
MRKLLALNILMCVLLSGLMTGCSLFKKGSGNNLGGSWTPHDKQKVQGMSGMKRTEIPPRGMVLVPGGHYVVGASDEDIMLSFNNDPRTETVDAFWMDQTEITNYEYRDFVSYVKEYNLRKRLGQEFEEFLVVEDEDGTPLDEPLINWRERVNYKDQSIREIINEFNISGEEALIGKKEYDVRTLIYEWQFIDFNKAAQGIWNPETKSYEGTIINDEGEEVEIKNRGDFITRNSTYIYPDTLCWMRDFKFTYNEPFMIRYFWHPAYNHYPVVGISWQQALAYCNFRTETEIHRKGESPHHYRLPTEVEWEYAARGGLPMQAYPWGGPYTTNRSGCFLANFKPQRGKYDLDGGVRTLPVGSYEPNDFGLYDMAGNVAEWTNNAFDENAYSFYHDLSPTYAYNAKKSDPPALKRKVIRGGSWKDIAYYLQCGSRTFEYQDKSRSYIGFRCVRSYMGVHK